MMTQQIASEDFSNAPPLETIAQAQERIVEEFSLFDDWNDRYQNLIDFGRRLPPMPDRLKVEDNRIRNCQGNVWLAAERRAGLLHLSAASETGVVAGLLAIVVDVYSGRRPSDVLDRPLIALDTIGMTARLSPHRLAALREIVRRLRELAMGASDAQSLSS